jgi:phage-related protein
MADTRTLKLSLLADVQKFLDGMDKADNSTKSFSSKVGKYSKAMAKSFAIAGAAAGAYAIKLGIDGVQAAIEDEQSQVKLAQALRNTTNATDPLIDATERYITKQQLAFGIADTKLRPALANLARATGDVGKAQELTNLALDISVATGKDLETVSLTLGKAYNGNIGALTRLGIPLDDAIKKSGDFNLVQGELARLFGGAAQANTKTYAGQLAIVTERFGELKESIGVAILPTLKNLLEQVNLVAKGFSGEDESSGLSNKVKMLSNDLGGKSGGISLGESLRNVAEAFGKLFATLTDSDAKGSTDTLSNIANALNSVANGINSVANAYKKAKDIGGAVLEFLIINPGEGPKFADSRLGKALGYTSRAAGGPVGAGQLTRVGEFGPELFVPSGSGSIRPDNGAGSGVTIIMNGVIDGESARRSIERLLQDSSRRTGAVNLVGATL